MSRLGIGSASKSFFGRMRPSMNLFDEREADEREFDESMREMIDERLARPDNLAFVRYLMDIGMTHDDAIAELAKGRLYLKKGRRYIRPHTLSEIGEE